MGDIYKKYNAIPAVLNNPAQEYLQEIFINDFLIPNNLKYIKLKPISIDEVAVLIKKVKFIATPDTGIMHLALALDSYILTAFTFTNPQLVEIGSNKFTSIYEKFVQGALSQKQDIKTNTLLASVDTMYKKINDEK